MENNNGNNNSDPNIFTFVTEAKNKHICSLVLLIIGIILCVGIVVISLLFFSIFAGIVEFIILTLAVIYDVYRTYKTSFVHTTTLDKNTGKGTFLSKATMACACCREKRQEFNLIEVVNVTPGGGGFLCEGGVSYFITLNNGFTIVSPNLVPIFRVNEVLRFINEYKMAHGVQIAGYPPQQTVYALPQQQGAYPYPPQQGGYQYPPQQGGYQYPPQQGGYQYPPQQGAYPYPPQQYPPQQGPGPYQYPPQQGAVPPQQNAGPTAAAAAPTGAAGPQTSASVANDYEPKY